MSDRNKISGALVALIVVLMWVPLPTYAAPPHSDPDQAEADHIHVVQPGDTLILLALRYGVSPAEIALANNLSNPNLIFPEQELLIPGIVVTSSSLEDILVLGGEIAHLIRPGDTISSIADQYGVSVNTLIAFNHLLNPDTIQIGQSLQIPGDPPAPGIVRPPFKQIELSEPAIVQGRTLIIKVSLTEPATLSGSFEKRPLLFQKQGDGQFWTVVGIHALMEPNEYPISLTATLLDGRKVTSVENVTVVAGPYGLENITLDRNRLALLDAELIRLERDKLLDLWSRVSLRPRWESAFEYPVPAESLRITSNFGTRRRYNSSQELSFHGGTDFGGGLGLPIYAPAAGTVVLAEPLAVRGNAVLIDHGLGLYSGYWHQSQIVVTAGQEVQPGDLLGFIGDSGLVTGPHLHWELRLNGIAVDPMQWIQQSIP